MFDSQVLSFTLVAAALTLSPGADTMLVVKNVLRGGRNAGVATTFGICGGLFIHATLSALGISIILMQSATAFHLVKMSGACYLVYLGIQSIRRGMRKGYGGEEPGTISGLYKGCSTRKYLLEGLLTNVLNPKVAVFYLAFLPQFIGPTDPVLPKSLLLAGIHYVEGILWLVTLSFTLDRTKRFFVKSTLKRWLDGLCGSILVGLGVRLALERR